MDCLGRPVQAAGSIFYADTNKIVGVVMARRKTVKHTTTVVLDLGESNSKQELFYQSRKLYTAYGGRGLC